MRVPPHMPLEALVEDRIQEAIQRGEFDNLPGAGKPLVFDDDPLVPQEVRAAHRVLKNAGFVPMELMERRQVADLEALIPQLPDTAERKRAIAKLAVLRTRLGGRAGFLAGGASTVYTRKIIERLAGIDKPREDERRD